MFESALSIYTWFFTTTLVASIVTFGTFVLYYRLKMTAGANPGLLQ